METLTQECRKDGSMEAGKERLTGKDIQEKQRMENGEGSGEWENAEEWEGPGEWENAEEWDKTGEEPEWQEAGFPGRRKQKKREYSLTGSLMAKIVAFFLLGVSCLLGMGAAIICVYMEIEGIYSEKLSTVLMDMVYPECINTAYEVEGLLEEGYIQEAEEKFRERNLGMELIYKEEDGSEKVVWSTWEGGTTNLTADIWLTYDKQEKTVRINGHTLVDGRLYLARMYVDSGFPWDDGLKRTADEVFFLNEHKYAITGVAVAGIFLSLVCFLFLICGAGHRNGRKGIVPGALTTIHLDVLTVLFAGGGAVFAYFVLRLSSFASARVIFALFVLAGTALVIWATFYCMDFAVRVKMGKCWRYSLAYIIFRWLWRGMRFLCRGLVSLIMGLPLVVTTLNVYFGICILELAGVLKYLNHSYGFWLWALEKLILLPVVLYIAQVFRKLLQASQALAAGQGNYQVDTSGMIGAFREHGENLNSLALGISKAVEERTKSERMKTELISNVSHDLKTPLTSIINYADLIWDEVNGGGKTAEKMPEDCQGDQTGQLSGEDGKVREYAEVLLRQSRRLKKLMEDLVEASKATTGNLDVNLEPCEVGVLLSQAVGEYQQKMEEKELELIARQPEEPVKILADGRRLWRVFENLLNNICKYARESSRVYLSVEAYEKEARIIFRNMSKYVLDISGEELEERFVRGDKSRHMEGNGLGLSIAKSLVELQYGRMEIIIDGDLFKVVLTFPRYSPF